MPPKQQKYNDNAQNMLFTKCRLPEVNLHKMISTNEIIDGKLAHKKCAGHYDAETGSKIV